MITIPAIIVRPTEEGETAASKIANRNTAAYASIMERIAGHDGRLHDRTTRRLFTVDSASRRRRLRQLVGVRQRPQLGVDDNGGRRT